MATQSKVDDPRFWDKWKKSGAVGDIDETARREEVKHFREMWRSLGNLDRAELAELVQYEFRQGPESVDEQVRRYYLQIKSHGPDLAAQMLTDTQPILNKGTYSVQDVEKLCRILRTYGPGHLIRHEGESYTVHGDRFDKSSNF